MTIPQTDSFGKERVPSWFEDSCRDLVVGTIFDVKQSKYFEETRVNNTFPDAYFSYSRVNFDKSLQSSPCETTMT